MTTKPRRPGAPARPPKDLPPLGRELRKLRESLALTMADAAAKCAMSAQRWHDKETGKRAASIEDLQAIAKGFGVAWKITAKSIACEANE